MSLLHFKDPRLRRNRAGAARGRAATIAPDARAKMQADAVLYEAAVRADRRLATPAPPAIAEPDLFLATRVLIVEDDAWIGLLLEQLLDGLGCRVCATAATQAEAVALALRHRPDLMIVDMQLRNGTGIAAVEEIGRTAPIPHIFISGAPADLQAQRPGAVVVGKPFRPGALKKAITQALVVGAGL